MLIRPNSGSMIPPNPGAHPLQVSTAASRARGLFHFPLCLPCAHKLLVHRKHSYYNTFYFTGKICLKNQMWFL